MYLARFVMALFVIMLMADLSVANSFAASGSKAGNLKTPKFAAIAYSKKTGSYGYATNEKSKLSAQRAAKRECQKHARDCKSAAWTRYSCVSLATDPGGGWGAHFGVSRKNAVQRALKKCGSYRNNLQCTTLVTVCQ